MATKATNNKNSSVGCGRKRAATDTHNNDDPVIGLNVGGRKFYTHQSTLTNRSAYFAARFSGNFGTDDSITDEDGREVYFIDASPELFEHILGFLRRGIPTWPKKYKEDRVLYERLINEAEYFGVESMLMRLRKSMRPFVCEPDGSGKDILYWLGTHGGRSEYTNPLDIGAVTFGGSCLTHLENQLADPEGWHSEEERTEYSNTRKEFIQHRPLCGKASLFDSPASDITNESPNSRYWYDTMCFLIHCDQSYDKLYLDITFENITIMPSHYSLRYSDCYGMTCWDFQASVDGVCWITLHKARNEKSIQKPSGTKCAEMLSLFQSECQHLSDASTKQSIATSIVEKELRGTWKVEALNTFYKYFRFKGAGEDCVGRCMHGVGFEIYGEVEEG
jgi:hypothetical protein